MGNSRVQPPNIRISAETATTTSGRSTFLLCKMSPASHFFFMRKAKKNNDIFNLFTVVVKKHFRQTLSPASHSRCIFKNLDSRRHKGLRSLRCRYDRMRLHAIACDCMRSLRCRCDLCDVDVISAMSQRSLRHRSQKIEFDQKLPIECVFRLSSPSRTRTSAIATRGTGCSTWSLTCGSA